MNLSPQVPFPSDFLVIFKQTSPSNPPLIPQAQQHLHEALPKVILMLGKRIGEKEAIFNLEKKQIVNIKDVEELKDTFRSILSRTAFLIEKGLNASLSSSEEIKDLDEEVSKLEEGLYEAFKKGNLTVKDLEKELQIAKEFHRVLWSMNDYFDFQKEYSILDAQLDHSLVQINDSLFNEQHGLSEKALLGAQESLENIGHQMRLTLPLLRDQSPFVSEIVRQLNFGINSTASACSDWLSDLLSHSREILASMGRHWEEEVKKQGPSLEQYASLKETGTYLLSAKSTLEGLKTSFPYLKKLAKTIQKQLKEYPEAKETLKNLTFLLQEIEKAERSLPILLEGVAKAFEGKEIINTIEDYNKESFDKKTISSLIERYKQGGKEGKLEAYIHLKRQLNAATSLSKIEKFFCEREEKRLSEEFGEALDFEALMEAQLIREAQPKPNWLSQAFGRFSPENWSEGTKRAAHIFLTAIQLTSQRIELNKKMGQHKAILLENSSHKTILSETMEATKGFASALIKSTGSFLSAFGPNESGIDLPERVIANQQKIAKQLKGSRNTLNQLKSQLNQAGPIHDATPLQQLKQESSLLLESLRKTMLEKPEPACLLPRMMEWTWEVEKERSKVAVLEKEINKKMKAFLTDMPIEDCANIFGNKHEKLVMQAHLVEAMELPGVHVPLPRGVSTEQVTQFLKTMAPQVFKKWEELGTLHAHYKEKTPFLEDAEAGDLLASIQQEIEKAFFEASKNKAIFDHLQIPVEIQNWLIDVEKQGNYLMVRSTGAEDSGDSANAGGNVSVPYVKPTYASFAEAMGQVVSSYFSTSSLKNRLNAGLNPFKEELKLAITAQELIGEPLGGASLVSEIPLSMVLFTNEPLYSGGEEFRTMRISATFGHGQSVVEGNQGIATDTVLILTSAAHPEKIYILYDNQKKPERLAPVKVNGQIKLKKVPNPQEMLHSPVLSKDLILRLYQWGILGEKFFENYPTDMEIVVKGGKIFPVQARPVNRPSLLPTYVDLKKIENAAHSPIIQTLQTEMIVPGKASVVEITKPEEILICDTLEKAEGLFSKGQHKLVVVNQQEPANSHPVVNFSSLGMPCLCIKDLASVQHMANHMTDKKHIVACIQSGTLYQWDAEKGVPLDYTTQGFVVHPAKVSISLTVTKPVPQYAGTPSKIPQEINKLILKIGMAASRSSAKKLVEQLQSHKWLKQFKNNILGLEKKVSEQPFLEKVLGPTIEAAQALDRHIEEAFEHIQAVLKAKQEQKLELLFHVKVLANLLQDPAGEGIGKYSVAHFEGAFQAADALAAYQEKLPHEAIFADILMDGTQSPVESVFDAWSYFLLQLEPIAKKTLEGESTGLTPGELYTFKEKLDKMRKWNVLPLFMTFFLGKIGDPIQTVKQINTMILPKDIPIIDAIDIHKQEINSLANELGQFANPKSFPLVWNRLKTLAESFRPDKMPCLKKENWNSASPIVRSFALKAIKDLVDVFDLSIKSMKVSQEFKDPLEKVKKFKEMLVPYLDLLERVAKNTAGNDAYSLHQKWNIINYLNAIRSDLNNMPDNNTALMNPSRAFSVSAATLGSKTDFDRHRPQTLEDAFTLIHQNLLATIAVLTKQMITDEQLATGRLPENLKQGLKNISLIRGTRPIGKPEQIGVEANHNEIAFYYNVPLRNHSSKFSIHLDRQTQKMEMKALFLGEGRARWRMGLERVLFLNKCGVLPLKSPKLTQQELSYIWDITNNDHISTAYEEFGDFAEQTLDHGVSNFEFIERIEKKLGHQQLLEFIFKDFSASNFEVQILNALLKKEEHKEEIFHLIVQNKEFSTSRVAEVKHVYGNMIHQLLYTEFREKLIRIALEGMKENNESITRSLSLWSDILLVDYGFVYDVVAAAKKGMNNLDSEINLRALKLFDQLINKDRIHCKEAFSAAQIGIKNLNSDVYAKSTLLLQKLAEAEYEREQIFSIFKPEISKFSLNTISNFIGFLEKMVKKDTNNFKNFVFLTKDNFCLCSIQILSALIPKGYGIDEGMAIVKETQQNKNWEIQKDLLPLYDCLLNVGKEKQIAKEAIILAGVGIKDISHEIREQSLQLFKNLVQKDEGLEEALEAAKLGLNDPIKEIKIESFKLISTLIDKGLNTEKNLEIVMPFTRDTNNDVRGQAIILLARIVQKEKGIKEAIDVAINVANDVYVGNNIFPFISLIRSLIPLVGSTINDPQEIKEILKILLKGMKSGIDQVEYSSAELLMDIIKKGNGIEKLLTEKIIEDPKNMNITENPEKSVMKKGVNLNNFFNLTKSLINKNKNKEYKNEILENLLEKLKYEGVYGNYFAEGLYPQTILKLAIEKGIWIEEIAKFAKETLKNPLNKDFHHTIVELVATLFKKIKNPTDSKITKGLTSEKMLNEVFRAIADKRLGGDSIL